MQQYTVEIYSKNEKKSWCDKQTYTKLETTDIELPLTVWGQTVWKKLLQTYEVKNIFMASKYYQEEQYRVDSDTKITSDMTTIMVECNTRYSERYSVLPKFIVYV